MERFFPKFTMFSALALLLTFSLTAANKDLMKAIEANDMQDFKKLLLAEEKINEKDQKGKTLLHYAAWFNRPEMAEIIIAKGGDVNARDLKGDTPLLLAASKDFPKMCEFLISKGADEKIVNSFGENYTQLLKKFEGEAKPLNTIRVAEKDLATQNAAIQATYTAQAKRLTENGKIVNPSGFYIQAGEYVNKIRNKTIKFDTAPETGKNSFTVTLQMDDGISEKVTGTYHVEGDCIYMTAKNYNDLKLKIMESNLLFEPRTGAYYSLSLPSGKTAAAIPAATAPAVPAPAATK